MAELRWRGLESVPEITSTLLKHEAATLHLPASYHHALCVRLCTDDSAPGVIDTTGDASLLHKAASIQGLGDLASLCESLTRAGALVRICSPAPRIYFMRPQTKDAAHGYEDESWAS
jgi:hypothetical protein